MPSIAEWLGSLQLGQYAQLFAANEVDLEALKVMTDADLKELGLPFGPRKRVLHAIREFQRGSEGGERRQLTVLFCDMAGFTTLASRLDPEILQTVIREYEDTCAAAITRYEGYVFQRLGDGIVAFFGYPLAHEREAERAIRAGLEIVESMVNREFTGAGRLQVRIGIATGVVVVSNAGKGAVGETMNLASRLQGIAPLDGISVSERVHQLAGEVFEYEELGEQSFKGIARPRRAWRVKGVSSAPGRFDATAQQGLTPLVGRGPEFSLLEEKCGVAFGGAGQFVLLSGEPGIGKSRILSALRESLESKGVASLRFRCSPYHVNSAYYPVADYFSRLLGFSHEDSPESRPEARMEKLEKLVVREHSRPAADVPLLAGILSVPFEQKYGPIALSPQRIKDEAARALLDLIEAIARSRRAVMLFEDLHWADPTTLDLLRMLANRIRTIPLMIAATARPEFSPAWLAGDHVTTVSLTRLSAEESAGIISRLAGNKPLPPGLIEQIVERTDGVPLFVEELTRTILESGDLVDEGSHYRYAGSGAGITVPATLRDALTARLDRLQSAKELAQIGAAIGREFRYDVIAAVASMPAATLDENLQRLTESGLVFRRGAPPGAIYTFKHALVQDTAYDSLLKKTRQQLHARIAQVFDERFPETRESEPELLARHYDLAGMDAKALPLWSRAAKVALGRFALLEAAAHLQNGLRCLAELPRDTHRDIAELELRTLLGPTIVALHGWAPAEVRETLEPAWRLAESLHRIENYLPILHTLWVHYLCHARLAISLEWAQKLLDSGAATGDDGLVVTGHRAANASYYWIGDFASARRHGDALRAVYNPERHWHIAAVTNTDPLTAEGIYRPQYLWMLGYPDQAVACCIEKDAHAKRRNHPIDMAFGLTLGAQVFDYLGEPEELRRRAEDAERLGREHHVPLMSEIMAGISRGVAFLRAGDFAEAVAQLETSVTRLGGTGHLIWIWYLRALWAEAIAMTGDTERALVIAEQSAARIEEGEEHVHLAEVLRLTGWMLMRLERGDEADKYLHRSLEVARGQQANSWQLRTAMTLARLLAGRGEAQAGHDLLAPLYDWFTEGFTTKDLRDAKILIDQLERKYKCQTPT